MKGYSVLKILVRSFSFLGGSRFKYVMGWILSSLEFAIAFITPYIYRLLVEYVADSENAEALNILLALFIALILIAPLVSLGAYLRFTAVAEGAGNTQKIIFHHLQHLPILKTIENKKGDYINRLSSDASTAVSMFQGYAITGFCKFIVYFFVSFILLSQISYVLLSISVGFSIISFIFAVILNPKARALERVAKACVSDSVSYLVEAFRCMPVIRVFLLKDRFVKRYNEVCRAILSKRVSFRTLLGSSYGAANLFSFAVQPIGLIVGAAFLFGENMDMAQIVFAVSIMAIMANGMKEFGNFTQIIQYGLVASSRVFELLDDTIEDEKNPTNLIDKNAEFAICFDNVSFSYPTGDDVLKCISFDVKRGETVALVGGSGGGKTTILKLMQALYKKSSGDIRLYGVSVDDLSLTDIRGTMAYVQQDCFLFDGTIYENIGLNVDKYDMHSIEEAAGKANIHEFIVSLPDGYNTIVGERGTLLSGGQRQRITIARALLKDAPLLLLDEATAALDSQTELEIQSALDELLKDRTVVIAAHRLSTIKNANKILVVEDGKIIEKGLHNELIKKRGRYYSLVQSMEAHQEVDYADSSKHQLESLSQKKKE